MNDVINSRGGVTLNLSKRELVLTGLIIILLAVNIGLILRVEIRHGKGVNNLEVDSSDLESYFLEEEDYKKAEIVVHITGQVKNQGVIYVPEGARVIDGIKAAGGPLQGADMDRINLARVLQDGEKLYVPAFDEVLDNEMDLGYNEQINLRININTASTTQLETLQGIGPVLARRIVDFREKEGRYAKTEDIMKVSGIGPKVYENLKDSITVK